MPQGKQVFPHFFEPPPVDGFQNFCYNIKALKNIIWRCTQAGRRGRTRNAIGPERVARVRIPTSPPKKGVISQTCGMTPFFKITSSANVRLRPAPQATSRQTQGNSELNSSNPLFQSGHIAAHWTPWYKSFRLCRMRYAAMLSCRYSQENIPSMALDSDAGELLLEVEAGCVPQAESSRQTQRRNSVNFSFMQHPQNNKMFLMANSLTHKKWGCK